MADTRLEILEQMVARNPGDSFSRYGLAMEYRSCGSLEDAVREFGALLERNPDYVAAYFHYGQALEALGRSEEANRIYRAGIEAATRKGDGHARSELQAALELSGI